MRTIYKYRIPIQEIVNLEVPGGVTCTPVHVGAQYGELMLWVEVETLDLPEPMQLRVSGTGWPLAPVGEENYIGTAQVGEFVWHIYMRR